MTSKEAVDLGYEVVAASGFEVGLTKNGQGIRTWWLQSFGGTMPTIDHPKIMHTIEIQEAFEKEIKK